MMKIWVDGTFYEKEEASISVYDHGLLYGDGIFEGIRIYNGKIFLLDEHVDRLYDSARAIALTIPHSKDEMKELLKECVSVNGRDMSGASGYIRLVVTRGAGDLGMDPAKCSVPSVIIIVDDISLYPGEYYQKGISIVSSSLRRPSADTLNPRIKSLNYLNNIMAKIEAKQSACIEALILNQQGYIVECTADNIFIVKNNTVMTPPLFDGALGGITRLIVIQLLEKMEGVSVAEKSLTQFDLYTADECFLTGSAAEVMPVVQADGRDIGNACVGELSKRLQHDFKSYRESL